MKFEKFVKKHTKTLFLIIIVVLAGSMIFTFNYGGAGSDNDDKKQIEGKIIIDGKEVDVSLREFHDVYDLLHLYLDLRFFVHAIDHSSYAGPISFVYLWYLQEQFMKKSPIVDFALKMQSFDQNRLIGMGSVKGFDFDKEEDRRDIVWETLILKHIASHSGINVTNKEITEFKNSSITLGSQRPTTIQVKKYLSDRFGKVFEMRKISESKIDEAIKDTLLITKYLSSTTESYFPSISQIYDKYYQESYARKRFKFGLIDSSTLASEIRPISQEEIIKYYERHKDAYKTPEVIQLCYLAGFYQENKLLASEPTDKEIENYYNENKDKEFKKEGSTDDKPLYKELNDVKDQIKEKIHKKRIQDVLIGAMYEIRGKVVDEIKKLPPEKQNNKDEVGKLAEKFANEASKYKIKFDNTTLITLANYEEIEKTLGKDSKIKEILKRQDPWNMKVGDISSQMAESDKAIICYILTKRIESRHRGPSSEDVRQDILDTLQREALKKRAKAKGEDIVKKINDLGPQAKPTAVKFYSTEYINQSVYEDDRNPLRMNDVSVRYSPIKSLGMAKAYRTESRGSDGKDYEVVIYLDDVYYPAVEQEVDSKINSDRRESILEERLRKMDQTRQGLVKENLERLRKK